MLNLTLSLALQKRLHILLGSVFFAFFALFPSASHANILGTDTQNFNPTTNGLDFVTVQSSETLQPGILNFGLFFNYASGTLAYSRDLPGVTVGDKPGDRILGMDLSFGLGLAPNWDVGVSLPAVLSQELDRTQGVARYDSNGFTELKLNSKYRILGDASGGLAAVVSANFNFIKDNPFTGSSPGPTLNFEVAADTTLAEKYSVGFNVGYRKRNPGAPVSTFPFAPFKDQWIASIAGSYLVSAWDTKLITEIFASRPTESVSYDQDRSQSTLEGLLGLKHDMTSALAVHAGAGSQLTRSVGSPEWRVYVGLNYAMGPIFGHSPAQSLERVIEPRPQAIAAETDPEALPGKPAASPVTREVVRITAELLFEFDSAELKPEARLALDQLVGSLEKDNFKSMKIEGHTDSVGKASYNLRLSQRRADSVRDYLQKTYHLDSQKIKAVGYGQTVPIADNGNFQGRKANRRVEFVIER